MSDTPPSDLAPSAYQPDRSLTAKVKRRLTQWRTAKPMLAAPTRAFVTFTFDDFPKSAADTGASILERFGGHGGYYACTGLMGQTNETGAQFLPEDAKTLDEAGHEICAHSQTHLDCARISPDVAVADIRTNASEMAEWGLSRPVTQFAYPFGETQTALKQALIPQFDAARGILPGVNTRGSDLMQLRALELEPDDATTARAAAAIEKAATTPAWVIIFTHDVRANPSPFGTTPAALESLVRLARDSGAAIMGPSDALAAIRAEAQ